MVSPRLLVALVLVAAAAGLSGCGAQTQAHGADPDCDALLAAVQRSLRSADLQGQVDGLNAAQDAGCEIAGATAGLPGELTVAVPAPGESVGAVQENAGGKPARTLTVQRSEEGRLVVELSVHGAESPDRYE